MFTITFSDARNQLEQVLARETEETARDHVFYGKLPVLAVASDQQDGVSALDDHRSTVVFFQDFEAWSDVKYEGQRVDGTHAVNGTIYLETLSEDFQC